MASYKPKYRYFKGIRLEELIFDAENDGLTVWASVYLPEERRTRHCNFFADFSQIATFFLMNGDRGDALLEELHNVLSGELPEEDPVVFSLNEPDTQQFYLPQAVVKVYKPRMQEKEGRFKESKENDCFVIDAIIPLREYIVEERRKKAEKKIEKILKQLGRTYKKYLKRRFEGLSEEAARQEVKLEDELLFTLAEQRHLMNCADGE